MIDLKVVLVVARILFNGSFGSDIKYDVIRRARRLDDQRIVSCIENNG